MISLRHVKKFCCGDISKIENYDKAIADDTQIWHCHHRMEAIYSMKELIKYGLYYNCEPHQLIFLTPSEHQNVHWLGRKHTEETLNKLSESHKGQVAWNKGKKCGPLLEECKNKLSECWKGKHWKLVDGKRVWY